MTFLLDNSSLIAWLFANHPHHTRVLAWEPNRDLAICPITELGFIRVACQVYEVSMADARKILEHWKTQRKPQFVDCDISALDGIPAPTGKDSTDFYLCNLADKHGMKWATLESKSAHPAAERIP